MNVKNVEAEIRFKYNEASQSSQSGEDKEYTADEGGISNLISKAATTTGLIAQQPEISHLVSTIRQEFDSQMQTYQYQMHSYTSRNEFFIIDIGSKIGPDKHKLNGEVDDPKQKDAVIKARLAQPTFPLNISVEYFIPIQHQDQLLKTIEKCGQFNQPSQLPGARKKSSAQYDLASNKNKDPELWLEQIEYETYYPRLMLEQRMNQNIQFRKGNLELEDEDFEFDIDKQLSTLTHVSAAEKDRLQQQSQYYSQNRKLFEIQANRESVHPDLTVSNNEQKEEEEQKQVGPQINFS